MDDGGLKLITFIFGGNFFKLELGSLEKFFLKTSQKGLRGIPSHVLSGGGVV